MLVRDCEGADNAWSNGILLALFDGRFFYATEEYKFVDCRERFLVRRRFRPASRFVSVDLRLQCCNLVGEVRKFTGVDRVCIGVAASAADHQRNKCRETWNNPLVHGRQPVIDSR